MDVGDVDVKGCGAADAAAAVRGKQMQQQVERAVHDNWKRRSSRRHTTPFKEMDNNINNFTDSVAFTLCWQCWSGLQLFCGGCQRL